MEAILRNVPLCTLNTDGRHAALAKLVLRSVRVVYCKLPITFLNPLGWLASK